MGMKAIASLGIGPNKKPAVLMHYVHIISKQVVTVSYIFSEFF